MKSKFVVAIGLSAGGQQPLLTFFDLTPHDKAIYVILRHLPYEYQSRLQSILERHTKLKIVEVVNGMPIENDTVYMPAKGMYMTIGDDKLYLTERSLNKLYPNRSFDIFLASLAESKGKKGIAIILSGTGTDGSKGVSLINKAGGMVIAQKPESCEYSSMPINAIKTGSVQYILDIADMPSVVLKRVSDTIKNSNQVKRLTKR